MFDDEQAREWLDDLDAGHAERMEHVDRVACRVPGGDVAGVVREWRALVERDDAIASVQKDGGRQMSVTPLHPLAKRGGPYTSGELRQIVAYEGIWGLARQDMAPAWDLVRGDLVEITCLHGAPVATWVGPSPQVQKDGPA